jgi:sulfur-carrier protein
MPRVILSGSSCQALTGGQSELDVTARTFGGLIRELDARFPGLGAQVEAGMAIAIDGVIHQDAYGARLEDGSEIYLIPKIAGG